MRSALLAALALALPAAAQTVTVTSDANSGPGSLRAAIQAVNAAGGGRIEFAIPGDGPHTIRPTTNLPELTVPVVVDGLTQPGAECDPLPTDLRVQIDGSRIDPDAQGQAQRVMSLSGGASTVRGLAFFGETGSSAQGSGTALWVWGDGNLIECNRISLRADGQEPDVGGSGLRVSVPFTSTGTSNDNVVVRNVSGRALFDLSISGDRNRVQGNRVGWTGPDALVPSLQPSGFEGGVLSVSGADAVVGGPSESERNLVAGSLGLQGSGHRVEGNWVGINAAGDTVGSSGTVSVSGSDIRIGGRSPARRNVMALLRTQSSAERVTVWNNYIGTDPTGLIAHPRANGVVLAGVDVAVGGASDGEGNVIVGGVDVRGEGHAFVGNWIGTDRTGAVALDSAGVEVRSGAADVVIGGAGPGEGNVITGAEDRYAGAVTIRGGSTGVRVLGNWIGTDRTGTVAFGNPGSGVRVDGASDVVVGSSEAPNVIAFAAEAGVHVLGESGGVAVSGNRVYAVGGLTVDLDGYSPDGPTANDVGDADEGPNRLQNAPEITGLEASDAEVTVTYLVDTAPARAAYPLRVEALAVWDTGAVYLGADTVPRSEARAERTAAFALGAPLPPGAAFALGAPLPPGAAFALGAPLPPGAALVLVATDADGNTGESTAPRGLTGPVASEDGLEARPLAVAAWPNPASTRLRVRAVGAGLEAVRLEVLDALGRRVASSDGPGLEAEGLAPGVYVVRAATGGRTATRTVTVVR